MKPLNVSANCSPIDITVADFDTISACNLNHDALLVCIFYVLVLIGAVDVNANFFDKRCRHDEEDEHDKNNVEHRCEVDFAFFLLLLCERSLQFFVL